MKTDANGWIVAASALATLAIMLAWVWVGRGLNSNPAIPYGVFVVYTIYMIKARKGFGDPAVISLFTFILYSVPPLFVIGMSSSGDFGLDVQGAYYIFSVASVAMIVATGLAFGLYPSRDARPASTEKQVAPSAAFYTEAVIAAGLSVLLSTMFIARYGIYEIGGSGEYFNRFADLATPGSGVLLLSAPLATGALCFAIVSENRAWTPVYAIFIVPYVILFLALGQRKYLLIPFLLLAFRFVRLAKYWQLVAVLAVAGFAYIAFNYVGFLREANIALSAAFDSKTLALFSDDLPRYLNGEVYLDYLTASSAYSHALNASFVHNYVDSFITLLPRFLFGFKYTTIDQSFAELVAPDVADLNGGYGFSYFGEAYLVGGEVGIFLAAIAMTLFLRRVFVWGKGLQFRGIGGVASLALTYHAMWYLRLSFVIFLHEVTIQIALILVIYAVVRLISLGKSKALGLQP